jgi:hypothetical protein
LKILKQRGCIFAGHGKKHDRYFQPQTGVTEQVPRHADINENLARQIIKNLS